MTFFSLKTFSNLNPRWKNFLVLFRVVILFVCVSVCSKDSKGSCRFAEFQAKIPILCLKESLDPLFADVFWWTSSANRSKRQSQCRMLAKNENEKFISLHLFRKFNSIIGAFMKKAFKCRNGIFSLFLQTFFFSLCFAFSFSLPFDKDETRDSLDIFPVKSHDSMIKRSENESRTRGWEKSQF